MSAAIVEGAVSASFTVQATNRAEAMRRARVIARNLLGSGYAATLDVAASPAVTAHSGAIASWEFDVSLIAEKKSAATDED